MVELVAACNTNSRGSLGREEFLVQWNIFKQKVAEGDETEEEIKEAFRYVTVLYLILTGSEAVCHAE